jgi:hypothetical protein
MGRFFEARHSWSMATFGGPEVRGPIGPLRHLAKEVQEAIESPGDVEEYADLITLAFDAADRAGFSYEDIVSALWAKLAKNRERLWPSDAPVDQPVEHQRERP